MKRATSGRAAAAAAAAQRPPDPSEMAMQQAAASVGRPSGRDNPSMLFTPLQLQGIAAASAAAQSRIAESERPVLFTTNEALAMVWHYRYGIRAAHKENQTLRNVIAVIWAERQRPDQVPFLFQDVHTGDNQSRLKSWTSEEELASITAVLMDERHEQKSGGVPKTWAFPRDQSQLASSPQRNRRQTTETFDTDDDDNTEETGNVTSDVTNRVTRQLPKSTLGWVPIRENFPPEESRFPLADYENGPSLKRAKKISTTGSIDPITHLALPSPATDKTKLAKLTPEQICEIAQVGLRADMNNNEEVFLTTGVRSWQIRPEYAWVLLIIRKFQGEDCFPLSRNRLARVFPEFEMVYCGQNRSATSREVQVRKQERSASGKFQASTERKSTALFQDVTSNITLTEVKDLVKEVKDLVKEVYDRVKEVNDRVTAVDQKNQDMDRELQKRITDLQKTMDRIAAGQEEKNRLQSDPAGQAGFLQTDDTTVPNPARRVSKALSRVPTVPPVSPTKISTETDDIFEFLDSQQWKYAGQSREPIGYSSFTAQDRDGISAEKTRDRWNTLDRVDSVYDAISTEAKEAADRTRKRKEYEEANPYQVQDAVPSTEAVDEPNSGGHSMTAAREALETTPTSASRTRSTSEQVVPPVPSKDYSTPHAESRDPRLKRKNSRPLHSPKRLRTYDGSGDEVPIRRRSARITRSKERLL